MKRLNERTTTREHDQRRRRDEGDLDDDELPDRSTGTTEGKREEREGRERSQRQPNRDEEEGQVQDDRGETQGRLWLQPGVDQDL